MLARFLVSSRYMLLIPVIGSWIAALVALIFGTYEIGQTVFSMLSGIMGGEKGLKLLLINLIEGVDIYLLGTAFFLIATGMYELIINNDPSTPSWLQVRSLDDLKDKLLNVAVVVLAVQFLAQVLAWDGQRNLLPYGVATGVVILSLALFLGLKVKKKDA